MKNNTSTAFIDLSYIHLHLLIHYCNQKLYLFKLVHALCTPMHFY